MTNRQKNLGLFLVTLPLVVADVVGFILVFALVGFAIVLVGIIAAIHLIFSEGW